jgi:hypothetical protein
LLVCHEGIQLYAGEFQINEMTDEVRYMGGELKEKDTAKLPCHNQRHVLLKWELIPRLGDVET